MSTQSHNITQAAHHLRLASDALERAANPEDHPASDVNRARNAIRAAREYLVETGQIMPLVSTDERTLSQNPIK